ncbi:MAG TPA: YfhO family protein, partial [Candidatus Elarobacter sp.]
YALGGFLISHLGHVMILQAAAWLPVAVWGVEEIRTSDDWRGVALLAVGIACLFLGGHPQVFIYGGVLTFAYAVFGFARLVHGARRYGVRLAAGFALGLGLCALTLLPSYQLLHWSIHQHLTFDQFIQYAVPLAQLPVYLFFPYFFGQAGTPIYPLHDGQEFGIEGGFVEATQYGGILALELATVAVVARARDPLVRFWSIVAIIALALSVGNDLRLAEVTYRLPIFNLTPAPGRNAMEFTFALAVLAGLGYHALVTGSVSLRRAAAATLAVVAAMAITLAVMIRVHGAFNEMAQLRLHLPTVELNPFLNASLGIPLALAVGSALAIMFWSRFPLSPAARVAVFALLAADAYTFAGSAYWHRGVPIAALEPAPVAAELKPRLENDRQRMLSVRGARAALPEAPPNVSMLWGLSSAAGYDSLEEARTANFLSVYQTGELVGDDLFREPDASLDLAGVRYALMPPLAPVKVPASTPWAKESLMVAVPADAASPANGERVFGVADPVASTEVLLATALQNSVAIRDGTVVAQVVVSDGVRSVRFPFLAGRDSSEIAYDRPDVKAVVKHRRARLYSSEAGFNFYSADLRLPARMNVRTIAVRWTGRAGASLVVRKISLVDAVSGTATPLTSAALAVGRASHWRIVRTTESYTLAENLHAFPRAWVVTEVRHVSEDQALASVRTRRLADGTPFEPRRVALVEEPVALPDTPDRAGAAAVTVGELRNTSMELFATCSTSCFVVTSDPYYPGWRASVDGGETTVYSTDYGLRGVVVPAGSHVVRFTYQPLLFYIGLALTVLSALALIGLCAFGRPIERRFFSS